MKLMSREEERRNLGAEGRKVVGIEANMAPASS